MTEDNELLINFILTKYPDGSVSLSYTMPITEVQIPVLLFSSWAQYREFTQMMVDFLGKNDTPIASAFLNAFKEDKDAKA